jgi:hypothetical protein
MKKLDYRWTKTGLKGQYVDGHEHEDVVAYRQKVFLPAVKGFRQRARDWSCEDQADQPFPRPNERHVVMWFHDESTFYANDRRKSGWVHKTETAVPYAKGEGPSQMVADVISADYGWLRSPDGKEQAWVFFKAGKNREGYFTSDEILEQATKVMDILDKHYPNEDHVLVFDNATTHTKRADGALSARYMPKFTSSPKKNWGVEVNMRGENGKPVYGPDGKILKLKIRMEDAMFADGQKQALYFEDGPKAGLFKGMAVLLQECGLVEKSKLNTECKKFKCKSGATNCCCCRVLYNQPDFVSTKSLLEEACEVRGYSVLFLPKFHCELNFIKQCWGFAKQIYRQYPASSKEANLERNVLSALESVPLENMRKCAIFSYHCYSYFF